MLLTRAPEPLNENNLEQTMFLNRELFYEQETFLVTRFVKFVLDRVVESACFQSGASKCDPINLELEI